MSMSSSALRVAIASENDAFDGAIYHRLLELSLGRPVALWPTEMRFDGHRAVYKLAETFLLRALQSGIRHAFLAVDNDGGSKRRPEHDDTHCTSASQARGAALAIDDDDACRECWLRSALPVDFAARGAMACVVVPVQTLETWLLHLRGDLHDKNPDLLPERIYDRRELKRQFFGRPVPASQERTAMALRLLEPPTALDRLRQRPSFMRMERQLAAWRDPLV